MHMMANRAWCRSRCKTRDYLEPLAYWGAHRIRVGQVGIESYCRTRERERERRDFWISFFQHLYQLSILTQPVGFTLSRARSFDYWQVYGKLHRRNDPHTAPNIKQSVVKQIASQECARAGNWDCSRRYSQYFQQQVTRLPHNDNPSIYRNPLNQLPHYSVGL